MRFRIGRRRDDARRSLSRPANQLVRRHHPLPFSTMPNTSSTSSDTSNTATNNNHHHQQQQLHNNQHQFFTSATTTTHNNHMTTGNKLSSMSPTMILSPHATTTTTTTPASAFFSKDNQRKRARQHRIGDPTSSSNYNDYNSDYYHSIANHPALSPFNTNELCTSEFYRSCLAECLSSCIYVFVVCAARISWSGSILAHTPNIITMALASGLAMQLLIYTFRSIHINPALTISMFLLTRISLVRALAYVAAQCAGGVAASALLYLISVRGHAGALGVDNPHEQLHFWHVLTVEAVISFFVTLVTFSAFGWSTVMSIERLLTSKGRDYHHHHPAIDSGDDCCSSYVSKDFIGTSRLAGAGAAPTQSELWPRDNLQRRSYQVRDSTTAAVKQQRPVSNIEILCQQTPYLIGNHYDRVSDEQPPSTTLIGIDGQPARQPMLPNRNNTQVMSSMGLGNSSADNHLLLGDSIDFASSDNAAATRNTRPFSSINPGVTNDGPSSQQQQQHNYYYADNCCTSEHLANAGLGVDVDHHQHHINSDSDDGYDNHQIYATQQRLRQHEKPSHPRATQFQNQQKQQQQQQRLQQQQQLQREENCSPVSMSARHLLLYDFAIGSTDRCNANGFPVYLATSNYAFAIGLAYALASLTGIPASGGSLNPARSFGPAFIMDRWTNHWIYWLGPVLGAVLGAFLYEFVLDPLRRNSCPASASVDQRFNSSSFGLSNQCQSNRFMGPTAVTTTASGIKNRNSKQKQHHQALNQSMANFLYQHQANGAPAQMSANQVSSALHGPGLLKANLFGADTNPFAGGPHPGAAQTQLIGPATSATIGPAAQHLSGARMSHGPINGKSQPSIVTANQQQQQQQRETMSARHQVNLAAAYTNGHNQLSPGPDYFGE